MKYNEFENIVLGDADNDLKALVSRSEVAKDDVQHVNRHVWDPVEPFPSISDMDVVSAFCRVGFALLRRWTERWGDVRAQGFLVSRPFLVIGDDWLSGEKYAASPRLYVCIAKSEQAYSPLEHAEARPVEATGCEQLDRFLSDDMLVRRLEGKYEDEPKAWVFELVKDGCDCECSILSP
jgi:hypothetical protein